MADPQPHDDLVHLRQPPRATPVALQRGASPQAARAGAATDAATPLPLRARITKARFALAILVSIVSDAIGFFLAPLVPVTIVLDVVTAIVLWLILGRGLVLLAAFVLEAIPGVGILPFWTLAVLSAEVLTSATQARIDRVRGSPSK